MRLRVTSTATGWAVVDRDGNEVWANESWLACVAWLNGYERGRGL